MKVLFLTDHPAAKTGVGTMTRNIIRKGDAQYDVMPRQQLRQNETSFEDLGINGLRQKLKESDPDVLLLFGDPGLFDFVFEAEHEIRSRFCPIAWYHVWDNTPAPEWNRPLYESCDTVIAASKLTAQLMEDMGFDPYYAPHGVDTDSFYREEGVQYFDELEGEEVITYCGRNQRRKNLLSLMEAFSRIGGEDPPVLALRTKPHGAFDLPAVAEHFGIADRVFFYPELQTEMLRALYNRSDVVVNPAYREGFGLPTLEAGFCGCSRVSAATGGLKQQIKLPGHQEVESQRSLNGEPGCPVIAEDRVHLEDLARKMVSRIDSEFVAQEMAKEARYTAASMASSIENALRKTVAGAEAPNRYYIDEV